VFVATAAVHLPNAFSSIKLFFGRRLPKAAMDIFPVVHENDDMIASSYEV
jgi:hypothetical protein